MRGSIYWGSPDTAAGVEDAFVFVSLDVDLYQPALAGLEYFYPRMAKGGCIFVHDYFSSRFPGVKKALAEYRVKNPLNIAPLGDNYSIVIIK